MLFFKKKNQTYLFILYSLGIFHCGCEDTWVCFVKVAILTLNYTLKPFNSTAVALSCGDNHKSNKGIKILLVLISIQGRYNGIVCWWRMEMTIDVENLSLTNSSSLTG